MSHNFLLIYSHTVRLLTIWLPDAPITMRFRGWLYSLGMIECKANFQVAGSAVIRGLENISCGKHVYIGPNAYIISRHRVIIEDEVLVAMNVVVVDSNHGKIGSSYRFGTGSRKAILVRKGAWLAANCVVTAGSEISEGSVVPPCTVVRPVTQA